MLFYRRYNKALMIGDWSRVSDIACFIRSVANVLHSSFCGTAMDRSSKGVDEGS